MVGLAAYQPGTPRPPSSTASSARTWRPSCGRTGCAAGGGLPRFVEREARRNPAGTTPGPRLLIAMADGAGGVTEPLEANNALTRDRRGPVARAGAGRVAVPSRRAP